MLITISEFTVNPPIQYEGTNPHLRLWYSNDFVAGDQMTPVLGGDGKTGFYDDILCTIDEDGNLVVPEFQAQATTESNPTAHLFGQLYDDSGAPRNMIIGGASGWAVPVSYGSTINFYQLALYNQRIFLVTQLNNTFTADQIIALIRSLIITLSLATDSDAGVVFLSSAADPADDPVVWRFGDPLVRDAIKLQGKDISTVDPSDGQLLAYNQATDQAEWSTAGFGLGNVVSNEVISVDSQLVVMSGTGGKTIKKVSDDGFPFLTAGVLSVRNFAPQEVPTGAIDGVNDNFELANTPIAGTAEVFVEGILQNSNPLFTLAYTIIANTITFEPGHIPQAGNSLLINYWY